MHTRVNTYLFPPRAAASEHGLFVSQVLSHIGLVEDDDTGRVEVTRLDGRAGRGAKAEGHVGHGEHHDTLVLGSVLGDTAEVGLEDVVAVQEGKLTSGLDPDL